MKRLRSIAVLLTLAGCKGPTQSADGAKLFNETCARCHAPDGHGDPTAKRTLGVPDMHDPVWQARLTDDDIRRTVREGSTSKKMPPFGTFYSKVQLDALVAHVRGFRRAR